MHRSLQVTLRRLPDDLEIFPGHAYTAEVCCTFLVWHLHVLMTCGYVVVVHEYCVL